MLPIIANPPQFLPIMYALCRHAPFGVGGGWRSDRQYLTILRHGYITPKKYPGSGQQTGTDCRCSTSSTVHGSLCVSCLRWHAKYLVAVQRASPTVPHQELMLIWLHACACASMCVCVCVCACCPIIETGTRRSLSYITSTVLLALKQCLDNPPLVAFPLCVCVCVCAKESIRSCSNCEVQQSYPPPLAIPPLLSARSPPRVGGGRTTNLYHSITV